MKKLIFGIILLLVFGIPTLADAAQVRSKNNIDIAESEIISENLYLTGGKIFVNGTIEKDLSIASGDIFLNGLIKEDVTIIGGNTNISGSVNGDLRVIGAEINLSGNVGGDILLIGGQINILPESNISGDILLVGGTIIINNTATSTIRAIGADVKLKGDIGGNTIITAQNLNLEKDTNFSGVLTYFSPNELNKGENVNISGTVNFNKVDSIQDNGVIQQAVISFLNFWILLRFVTTLFLAFLLIYIFKIFSQKTVEYTLKSFLSSFITGFLVLILMPLSAIVLFISLILIPVSVLIILAYIFTIIISTAIAGIAVGSLIQKAFSKKDNLEISFNTAALGVVIMTFLQFVPVVGDITRIIFIFTAFGAIWKHIYAQIRWGDALFGKIKKQ